MRGVRSLARCAPDIHSEADGLKGRLLFALFASAIAAPAFAARCGTRIVGEGAQDFQVRERCGEPFYADRYYATEILGAGGPVETLREVQYDVWYYNFGPRALMRRFVFRDGVLAREDTLGYGVDAIGEDCNPMRDYRGISVGELVARCGDPVSRRTAYDAVLERRAPGYDRYGDLRREDWIYDFGDERFVRLFHVVDGRVDGIESIGR
jgi:Protein of unknown function (DUF2845)